MEDRDIIVITDSALFELGVSVGFGAVCGGLMAVALYEAASYLAARVTSFAAELLQPKPKG